MLAEKKPLLSFGILGGLDSWYQALIRTVDCSPSQHMFDATLKPLATQLRFEKSNLEYGRVGLGRKLSIM
jgi:hypothetical protein